MPKHSATADLIEVEVTRAPICVEMKAPGAANWRELPQELLRS
jgi:hypothetical protein